MAKRGKKFLAALSEVSKEQHYGVLEGLDLIRKVSFAKFDETVDVAIKLGVDPRHADQMVRGSVVLPNGTGKVVKILVFAKGAKATEATEAGADVVGDDDLVAKVDGGWLDFDIVIATPDMMSKVGRLGKVLGPRGLMPNPKIGTVTNDVAGMINKVKSGLVEFRVDKTGIVHCIIGKKSFSTEKLVENLKTLMDAIVKAKPSSSKGIYVGAVSIATTMGPGIKLDVSDLLAKI